MKQNNLFIHTSYSIVVLDFNLIKKYSIKIHPSHDEFILTVNINDIDETYRINDIIVETGTLDTPIHWQIKRICQLLNKGMSVNLPKWMNT